LNRFVDLSDVARAYLAAFESAATDVIVNMPGPEPITTGWYGWNRLRGGMA
jgi:UDP-glucose 4-epimerase